MGNVDRTDRRGYLALDGAVGPGSGGLRDTVDVDTDADAAQLEEILRDVEATG